MAVKLYTSVLLLMFLSETMSMVAAETCGDEKETCNHGCCMFNTRCCTQLEWKLWVHGIVPLVILGVVLLVVVACTLIAFLTPAPHGRVTGFSRFVTKGPPPPTSVGTIDYW
ncbi:uncharacterized protein LOC124258686 [Haliotis rubra]|uniref:uncharacterized protein LOC124258686 n=1 Tax=Haliotis rubra TaxID=36100 RepID=UPI001EE567D8|nr:uncharacterized protein LOC124258686 [Haliotis rubra]